MAGPSPARRPLKPHLQLATATTPDGAALTLHEHDRTFSIRLNGRELMHSSMAESERVLGALTIQRLPRTGAARVLIGGLGLGFTLRTVLGGTGPAVTIEVAELLPALLEWHRDFLGALDNQFLRERRVALHVADVFDRIARAAPATFDAVTLDIDNGPTAMVQRANSRLYDAHGLALITRALKPGGRLTVWSAGPDRAFERRLRGAGFRVETVPAKLHAGARQLAATIFVADLAAPRTGARTDDHSRSASTAAKPRPQKTRWRLQP